ncbi:MAG TPA: TonB-dependent receptor, partial [Bacteroidia bacterium]|nr:TonB-dependent receptor [Bacteroidia bacterium]
DLARGLTINVEPYYKYFWHLFDLNYANQGTEANPSDYIIQRGVSYGLDVTLKYQYKGLFLYGAYSLAYNTINNFQQIYDPYYDRRHNVNLVVAYDFGKKRDWEVSARWNFGSGFPFTQTQSFYESNPFAGGIGTNYATTNGQLGVIYASQLDGGRLPAYNRLDLEIKKIFSFKNRLKLEINASVSNVYDRQNIFYFNPITYTRVNQLPILPSLALTFSF